MGITENAAKRGLYHTGNTSADLAASWVFENLSDPELHKPFSPPPQKPPQDLFTADWAAIDESRAFKMVFVVNTSLGMGVGKTAAQVGHATLALYKSLLIETAEVANVRKWEDQGAKKIVVKGLSAEHLTSLRDVAQKKSIHNYLVRDAGKTQVPSGSITVLALFGKGYLVNEVTGSLGLL